MKIYSIFILAFLLSQIWNEANAANALKHKTEQGEQNNSKSSLTITSPNGSTIWKVPGKVKLAWTSENIPEDRNIMFYLTKDDTVVQELGIFKNNKPFYEIAITRGMQEGDNYRVIGIELFPDDKFNIAKSATALFKVEKVSKDEKGVKTALTETIEKEKAVKKSKIRDKFDGRKINYVNELTVDSKEICISLWDHGRKDGDIVSIYLNGKAIVNMYHLEYRKKMFNVTLDPSKPNDLFLYAHNLGRFPPNTVSIEITGKTTSENIVLNSDLKTCEAVIINIKE